MSVIPNFHFQTQIFFSWATAYCRYVGPCGECQDDCFCKFQFYLAPAMAGSQIHEHRMAWNALVRGRKRWFIIEPGHNLDALKNESITFPVYEWARDVVPYLRAKGIKFTEFYQYPGEIVLVPDHWQHAIVNIEPSLGFAVEINHVDATVLPENNN